MKRVLIGCAAVMATVSCVGGTTLAKPRDPFPGPPSFMRMYGTVQPPHGFVRFCETTPSQCGSPRPVNARPYASPELLSELDEVNREVNEGIQPETDLEIYGVTEHWALPSDRGDCEDYALLKRKRLLERGWPVSALLITVVRDEKGEGHAVLTARTSQGDYVLDNKLEEVMLWSTTPYRFVMRQSYVDPRAWVSLTPTTSTFPPAIAGFEQGER